jgi:ribonuclease Y
VTTLVAVLALLLGGALGALMGRGNARRRAVLAGAQSGLREAQRLRASAEEDRGRLVREGELRARETALSRRRQAAGGMARREEELASRVASLTELEARLGAEGEALAESRQRLEARQAPVTAHEQERAALLAEARGLETQARTTLETSAGHPASALRDALTESEIEAARASAAHLLRQLADTVASPEQVRQAKRIMGISVGRFSGHYLTERHLSIIPLPDKGTPGPDDLHAIETVAGIKLSLTEGEDAVRIEGLDGVGREVARRSLAMMFRRRVSGPDALSAMARDISAELDREIVDLGRRAFVALEIPRAHADIVRLVGRLNYRTSYTQNQWKHAVEAAFLCGMMADELRLDRKVARRAALMHDIGKALTHELDGSHAVIGADYARRLGEPEVVANAIGAHHTDEPFSSPYAYLVAAADAMSGARPGARRQHEDNHMAKLGDLERLTRGFPGVEEAFAVQGGREVRVYVREDQIDDLRAIQLSSDIAATISREMTFPGQIKVTVIREFRAVETAS